MLELIRNMIDCVSQSDSSHQPSMFLAGKPVNWSIKAWFQ